MWLYKLLYLLSYFDVLIFFLIASIGCAKKRHAWIWYFIGAIIAFMCLKGEERSTISHFNDKFYIEIPLDSYWTTYFLLLLISAIIIISIYSHFKAQEVFLDSTRKRNQKLLETCFVQDANDSVFADNITIFEYNGKIYDRIQFVNLLSKQVLTRDEYEPPINRATKLLETKLKNKPCDSLDSAILSAYHLALESQQKSNNN